MHRAQLVIASLVLFVGSARSARADSRALVSVEARLGGGLAMGGGAGQAVVRAAPLTVGGLAELAINADPWVTVYGGAYLEAIDRLGVGVMAGVRLRLSGPLRFGAGVVGVIAPYTLGGLSLSGGACWKATKMMRVCGDLEGQAYFLGSDLPDGRVVGQLQFVLSVGFDVW